MRQFNNMKWALLAVALTVMSASCGETDLYESGQAVRTELANDFNFATSTIVDLTVDFPQAATIGAIYFEVYDENPYVDTADESNAAPQLREGLYPIYAGYTNSQGHFQKSLTLPQYATTLYVTTGNMMVGATMIQAEVKGGRATAQAADASARLTRAAVTGYAQADGEKGYNVPENLWKGYQDGQYHDIGAAEWVTPLGRFDLHTGRPNYILQNTGSRAWYDEAVAKGIVFSEEEMQGLFETVGNAVNVDRACPEYLRVSEDLELLRESELAITLVGSFTGWNNSLGYYIYEGDAPTDLKDVQVIMLFPNTQDGCWYKTNGQGGYAVENGVQLDRDHIDYHGVIALNRGDAVQLKYYPHHTKGDFSTDGETNVFPAGTKIGFVLKNNGWGCQGEQYAVRRNGNTVHNWWVSTTNGLTVEGDRLTGNKPYLGSGPHTCKFQYKDFVVIGFEDYGDDENFSDLAFALKPAEAFKPLPVIEQKEVTTQGGVYAFEDLWPDKGDYDMNDVLVEYKYTKVMEKFDNESDDAYRTRIERFSFTTAQNRVTLTTGLGVTIESAATPNNVVCKVRRAGSEQVVPAQFTIEDNGIYLMTADVKAEIGSEYIIELGYAEGISDMSTVKPFIYRNTNNASRWEVHIPFEAPTARMDLNFFGTGSDLSSVEKQRYFVREGDYPFSFFLAGATLNDLRPLLEPVNERRAINELYPAFFDWATSNGDNAQDWYKR